MAALAVQDDPQHLSFSQLTTLHGHYRYACPRKWGYRYKLGLAETRSPSLALGSAMDEAANCFFSMCLEGADAFKAGAEAAELGLASLRQEPPDTWFEVKADNPLEAYEALFMASFSSFLISEGRAEVALVQDRHQFTIQRNNGRLVTVIGYSDRIDSDGGIVDHKFSGSPRWDAEENWHPEYLEEKRDQLLVYWLARAAEERRRGEPLDPPLNGKGRLVVTYHRLGMLKAQVRVKEVTLNQELADELLVRLAEAADIRDDGRLPLRPGLSCRFCSFLATCCEDQRERGTPFLQAIAVPF